MRASEDGQALVFAVIVLLSVLAGGLVLYNSGRLVLTKMHLQNTAESTAYSGAVLVARDYNFSAYANRAIVTNQVAIAQMVGLRPWARYCCLTYNDRCGNQQSSNDLPSQIQDVVNRSEVRSIYGFWLSYYKGLSQMTFQANRLSHAAASAGKTADLATTDNFGEATGSASYGSSYSVNTQAADTQNNAGAGNSIATYSGLPNYEDVSDTQAADFAAPTLSIVLDRPRATIMTTTQLGVASGTLATPGTEAGGQVEAMATAQAQFARPQASRSLGGKIVYGNLFNPYWEAHLAPTPASVRAMAVAAQAAGHR